MKRWLAALVFLAVAACLASTASKPILVDLSPLAKVSVDGKANFINLHSDARMNAAEVVADGFVDDQYLFEFPPGAEVHSLDLTFPTSIAFRRLTAIGWGGQAPVRMSVQALQSSGAFRSSQSHSWSATKSVAPSKTFFSDPPIKSVHVQFRGAERVILNSVNCHALLPRWQAWGWFLGLQLIGPWLVGGAAALAILGWGRLMERLIPYSSAPAERSTRHLLVGLAVLAGLSASWFFSPAWWRGSELGGVSLGLMLAPAGFELFACLRWRDRSDFLGAAALTAMLLLATVAVDSTFVANRRVKPMDHLFGYLTAQYLNQGAAPPEEMYFRPWLTAMLAAPLVVEAAGYAYWPYLGLTSWLNALALAPVALWAARWRKEEPHRTVGWFALLPVMTVLHFPGPRPLACGLALAAIYWWTDRSRSSWWLWAGTAAALAYLVHPGILFVFPGAAVYLLFAAPQARIRTCVKGLALPLAALVAWTVFVHHELPGRPNPLLYYPVMRTLNDPIPLEQGAMTILRSTSSAQWCELLLNRFRQIRHYAWANNPWHSAWAEIFRPVSLTSTLGVAAALALLRRRLWKGRRSFALLAIVSPLALLHLHIGQSFPQFHIVAAPFLALALLTAVGLKDAPSWLQYVVLGECLLRQLFPLAFVQSEPSRQSAWFVNDDFSCYLLSLIPATIWLLLAAWTFQRRRAADV